MYAYLFRAKGGGWELILTKTIGQITGEVMLCRVSGKREARKVATQWNATPWNF